MRKRRNRGEGTVSKAESTVGPPKGYCKPELRVRARSQKNVGKKSTQCQVFPVCCSTHTS